MVIFKIAYLYTLNLCGLSTKFSKIKGSLLISFNDLNLHERKLQFREMHDLPKIHRKIMAPRVFSVCFSLPINRGQDKMGSEFFSNSMITFKKHYICLLVENLTTVMLWFLKTFIFTPIYCCIFSIAFHFITTVKLGSLNNMVRIYQPQAYH